MTPLVDLLAYGGEALSFKRTLSPLPQVQFLNIRYVYSLVQTIVSEERGLQSDHGCSLCSACSDVDD